MPDPFTHSMDLPLRLGRRAIQARLDYTSADPHAVKLTLSDRGKTVTWLIDRTLLRDGCTRPVGVGVVQVRPGRHDSKVMIRLSSSARQGNPAGDVHLEASKTLVSTFIARTYAAVPAGHEHEWARPIDDELAELLEDGDRA